MYNEREKILNKIYKDLEKIYNYNKQFHIIDK